MTIRSTTTRSRLVAERRESFRVVVMPRFGAKQNIGTGNKKHFVDIWQMQKGPKYPLLTNMMRGDNGGDSTTV